VRKELKQRIEREKGVETEDREGEKSRNRG
jgi:hypothetical protein